MPSAKLGNAPLVEAILEVRWQLAADPKVPGFTIDPNYKLFVGRLFDRAHAEYAHYEALPSSQFPDEMMGFVAQHRFRVGEDRWPLIQAGPGLVTLNSTTEYEWEDFRRRSQQLMGWVMEAYPEADRNLRIDGLRLRYIDAIAFDFTNDDILQFMRDHLRVEVSVPATILQTVRVEPRPLSIQHVFNFRTAQPPGALIMQFARGNKQGQDALIWETIVQSLGNQVPDMPAGFEQWLKEAHEITHNLFDAMIEGRLREMFQ